MSEFKTVNMFIISEELTVIKSKQDARNVLNELVEQESQFTIEREYNNKTTFCFNPSYKKDIETNDYYKDGAIGVIHHDGQIDWLTPTLLLNFEDAVNTLWRDRKYYNKKWND